ncbi:S-layer homology domain-containing protein [Paenibacillus sp. LHD-117]|uniref:S-layer homology domain-containing protein n=1 Tax=Paenibacillus sp. LHD-117 TaxID=3071412 RepID=UPI0027E1C3AC|nr:S-layer homology domain-containing protein [Paenibacillus sp. LHD-117]MDQ6419969.1 S-layer homology domain-containing protein [Paenibacillus sp. LHD-117]
MKKGFMQGTVALLAGMLLVAPLQPSIAKAAEGTTFDMYFPTDIEDHWAYSEIDNFVVADLLKGYKDASGNVLVKPEKSITRAEFVAILVRALGLKSEEAGQTFTDVPAGEWFTEPVRIASSLGVVNGVTETEFSPNQPIERGEIATMIVRAFKDTVVFNEEAGDVQFDDVPASDYFATESIAQANEAGIVNGVEERLFKPFANAKRAQAVVMLQRALDLQESNLPDEEMLKSVILDADKAELESINKGEIQGLGDLLSKQYTAFQLVSLEQYIEGMQDLVKDGIAISVGETGARNLEVTAVSDRFAVIKSTGGTWQFTYAYDGEQQTETVSSDGHYYMKKTDDGTWKIYAIYEE